MAKKQLTTILKFDEINKAIPYRDYFGKMYISPKQMETRIGLAGQIEDVMLYVFAYWTIAGSVGVAEADIRAEAKEKMRYVIARHTKLDSYLEKHINEVIDEVIDTTIKNADSDSGYWLSRDRAMLIGENEANSLENYVEYRDARASGKTKKKWITELDDKVRMTHELAEGQTVDIDGLFLVGDSLMRFPTDTMYGADPKEIINCRCSVYYE